VKLAAQTTRLLANRKKGHSVESEKNLVLRVLFVTRIIKSEIFLGKKVPSYIILFYSTFMVKRAGPVYYKRSRRHRS
jgi:hypothetical protein